MWGGRGVGVCVCGGGAPFSVHSQRRNQILSFAWVVCLRPHPPCRWSLRSAACDGGSPGGSKDLEKNKEDLEIPYSWKFSLGKNLAQPTYMYPCITEIFCEINFRQCSKVCHRLYAIINMGQKTCGIYKNFAQVKIFSRRKLLAIRYYIHAEQVREGISLNYSVEYLGSIWLTQLRQGS